LREKAGMRVAGAALALTPALSREREREWTTVTQT
jgi:hypothetical protein